MADPVNTVAPVVSGTPTVGQQLACTTGSWTNTPTQFSYQWQRDGSGDLVFVDIAAAVSNHYTLVSGDIGCNVRCEVTASNVLTKRGVGFLRYGNAALPGSHLADYDLRIIDSNTLDQAGFASRPPTITYQSFVHLRDGDDFGVSLTDARANGWVCHSSPGVEMVTGAGHKLANVGAAGYRAAWAANVEAKLLARGFEGVFNDDCAADVRILTGAFPIEQPNAAAWKAAILGMVQAVGADLIGDGYKICHNAGWFVPGNASSDNGVLAAQFWAECAPYSTWLMNESWMVAGEGQGNPDPDALRLNVAAWYGNFVGWWNLLDAAYNNGAAPVCLTLGTASRRFEYAFAAFLLKWRPELGGVFIWADPDYGHGDPWNATFDATPFGNPTGPATVSGAVWTRVFANTTITLNVNTGAVTGI